MNIQSKTACAKRRVGKPGLQVVIFAYCYSRLNLIKHNLSSECFLLDGVAQAFTSNDFDDPQLC